MPAMFLRKRTKRPARKARRLPRRQTPASVASVNGVAITEAEVQKETDRFTRQAATAGQQIGPEQLTELRKEVLDSLISREVVYQESERRGLKAD